MKVGIVVISRFNSARLPGKALMKLGSKSVLELIIERLMQVVPISDIIIATSEKETDTPIFNFAQEYRIVCYRGSLDNVADRFYEAARSRNWDYAIRINGDNIFVDTEVLADMITLARTGHYDFLSNVKGRTFPKGMSIEIVRMDHYAAILPAINEEERYREHVTLYLYEHETGRYFYVFNDRLPQAAGIQMALDTPEDLERTRMIMRRFTEEHWKYNLKEIFTIWKAIEK